MDRLLARLERRFGRYALHGFTYFLVAFQALVFVLELTNPGFSNLLTLSRDRLLQGQVWRLVTCLFIPPSSSPFWVLFALYWLYTMGTSLERELGDFKYQIFWLAGMISTIVVALVFNVPATNSYLLMSVFLAFATLYPNFEIRLFFVVPVAVKWLALVDAAVLAGMVGSEPGLARLIPVLAVGNYLLFFGTTLLDRIRSGAFRSRHAAAHRAARRIAAEATTRRRSCSVCGVTDENREIEFRVCTCAKCGTPTDFCLPHSRNH